jgi:hypothetical protein
MKMRPGMVLAFAVALSGTLAGCGLFGGDDPEIGVIDVSLEITAATVEAVVGLEVTFSDGGGLDSSFAGSSVAFKFTSSTTWEATSNGEAVSGSIVYGSCSFFFSGGGPFGGNPFNPCRLGLSGDGNNPMGSFQFGNFFSAPLVIPTTTRDNGDGTCSIMRGAITIAVVPCGGGTGSNTATGV